MINLIHLILYKGTHLMFNLSSSSILICFVLQMYSEGSSAVKQDNKTAFRWFKKAADAVRFISLMVNLLCSWEVI